MIPEVVVAMLACARIGAPHNVVFGGFSADVGQGAHGVLRGEGAGDRRRRAAQGQDRADQGAGRQGHGGPRHAQAHRRRQAHRRPTARCRTGATSGSTRSWTRPTRSVPAEELDAEHPLYVLYTSGSTAKPKGVLHTTGGYLTGVTATHKYIFDLKPEQDVYWCAADVGWVTGHSYIVYAPLCQRRHERDVGGRARLSGTRTSGGRSRERYGVTIFYTAPTAIRACIKWGAEHVEKHRPVQAAAARARSASRSTPRPGSGTTRSSAASAARSSTPGGRPRPARS